MGQAWCKEKSSKAQDSKSPLDRVFVRCAHRIYPSLKEEGSVLGGAGATQTVTSSEIGYAVSAPRPGGLLQRGHSIDSVDRPFHPSEWVDVNLEVPCTPGAQASSGQRRAAAAAAAAAARLLKSNGMNKSETDNEAEENGQPVPPPRRRRRRESRSLPAGDVSVDDESEPELLSAPSPPSRSANRSSSSRLDDRGDSKDCHEEAKNSDDEFVEIEKCLLNEHSDDAEESPKPKNHSVTTSLPNVAELDALDNGKSSAKEGKPEEEEEEEEVAQRPPRLKTSSLPRDVSLFEPKQQQQQQSSPERAFVSARRSSITEEEEEEEGQRRAEKKEAADNSIFKIDTSSATQDEEPAAAAAAAFDDVKTSTPVKSAAGAIDEDEPSGIRNLDDAFDGYDERSNKSARDSSSVEEGALAGWVPVPLAQDVDGPPRSEDGGYESRSVFPESSSNSDVFHEAEASSGILKDAIVSSGDSVQLVNLLVDEEIPGLVVIQRTISEESLPREMLVEEIDEENDVQSALAKEPGKQDDLKTPAPLSPESKSQETSNNTSVNGFAENLEKEEDSKLRKKPETSNSNAAELNPTMTSMTPSLMELEAALVEMLEEEAGEEENKEQSKPQDKSSEPQIVPVKRSLPFKDIAELDEQPLADLPRLERTNPFLDLTNTKDNNEYNIDDPPEKPKRLERSGLLIEESSIDEPLIVPTPPRRRHRSKSNLSSTAEPEALHSSLASRDRLI